MDTLQNRLEKFLKVYGITMQYFEQQCNIAQGLGKKLSEKSYGTTFKRISEGFPQLNIEWLKTGKGTMINPDIGFSNVEQVMDRLTPKLPDTIPVGCSVQFRIKNCDSQREVVYERTKGKGF